MIELNLSGVFYCCREALQRFNNGGGGGYIINISSLAGKNAFSGGAGYNASKFGLNGFSEALMLDHRYENVRVSYIMPGSVDTKFGSGAPAHADWKIAPEDVAEVVHGPAAHAGTHAGEPGGNETFETNEIGGRGNWHCSLLSPDSEYMGPRI